MRELLRLPVLIGALASLACDAASPSGTDDTTDEATGEGAEGGTSETGVETSGDTSTSSSDESDESDAESSGSTETESGDTGEPPSINLFGCDLELSCELIFLHAVPSPPSALECAGLLVAQQLPGVVDMLWEMETSEVQYTHVLLGDGNLLYQRRSRPWPDGGAWNLGDPSICEVDPLSSEVEDACAMEPPGDACRWYGTFSRCQPLEGWTCTDVQVALGG